MKRKAICRVCGVKLTDENWYSSCKKKYQYICKSCELKRGKQWRRANPEKAKATWTRKHRKEGHQPFNENKRCPLFLGVHVAEQVLSQTFKNVKRMPMHNPGYDFICGRGYKIDVKSACKEKTPNRWKFHIEHNTIADYFLCMAFNNREDLDPLYLWLLPGAKVNRLTAISISPSTIHKWDAYRLDVTKVITCCNAMRTEPEAI